MVFSSNCRRWRIGWLPGAEQPGRFNQLYLFRCQPLPPVLQGEVYPLSREGMFSSSCRRGGLAGYPVQSSRVVLINCISFVASRCLRCLQAAGTKCYCFSWHRSAMTAVALELYIDPHIDFRRPLPIAKNFHLRLRCRQKHCFKFPIVPPVSNKS